MFAFCLLATSCATRAQADSDWNRLKIWHQVADNPPTYVPAGYGANQPRTESHGTWFTDNRDGKCLFVPKHAVGEWEPETLCGEARKVTGFIDKSSKTPAEKVVGYTLWSLFRVAAPVPLPD